MGWHRRDAAVTMNSGGLLSWASQRAKVMNELELFEEQKACNYRAYEVLRDQIRRDYAGQYVALAYGRLIAASPNFDEAMAAVQQLQPVPIHYAVFPADEEPAFEPIEDYWIDIQSSMC